MTCMRALRIGSSHNSGLGGGCMASATSAVHSRLMFVNGGVGILTHTHQVLIPFISRKAVSRSICRVLAAACEGFNPQPASAPFTSILCSAIAPQAAYTAPRRLVLTCINRTTR